MNNRSPRDSFKFTHKYIISICFSQGGVFYGICRKSLRGKEINIEVLSSFSRAPTFENFANAALKPLRRKEFGKTEEDFRVELCSYPSVCLR